MVKLMNGRKKNRLDELLKVDDPVFDPEPDEAPENPDKEDYVLFSGTNGIQVLTDKGPVVLSQRKARDFAVSDDCVYYIDYISYGIVDLTCNDTRIRTFTELAPNLICSFNGELYCSGSKMQGKGHLIKAVGGNFESKRKYPVAGLLVFKNTLYDVTSDGKVYHTFFGEKKFDMMNNNTMTTTQKITSVSNNNIDGVTMVISNRIRDLDQNFIMKSGSGYDKDIKSICKDRNGIQYHAGDYGIVSQSKQIYSGYVDVVTTVPKELLMRYEKCREKLR